MSAPRKSKTPSASSTKKGILRYVREKSAKRSNRHKRVYYMPGITGLKNLGSTCYMNSVVQCYSNTRTIYDFFIRNINYDGTEIDSTKMGSVATELRTVLIHLWSGAERKITPSKFCRVIQQRSNSHYNKRDQQDAHEFIMSFNEWLHEDLLHFGVQTEDNELSSIINYTFHGFHLNTITCSNCKNIKYKKELFSNVTLPVPSKGVSSLQICLDEFFAAEELPDFHCDGCNLYKLASYEKSIMDHPKVLVICLKRFRQNNRRSGYEKIFTKIEYPVKNLKLYGAIYNLYGVVSHRSRGSSLQSGHYYSIVRNLLTGNWFKYDDYHVYEITEGDVVQPINSYVLFYENCTLSREPSKEY